MKLDILTYPILHKELGDNIATFCDKSQAVEIFCIDILCIKPYIEICDDTVKTADREKTAYREKYKVC